jgi:hypothetical protein
MNMNKPERKNFMSQSAYEQALKSYEKHQAYINNFGHVIKTISGPADIWVTMELFCRDNGMTKSGFIFQAIKEKLDRS